MTLMMAITEETVVAGIMTFFFYGVLPTLIILYLSGSGQRRRRREQETRERLAAMQTRQAAAGPAQVGSAQDEPTSAAGYGTAESGPAESATITASARSNPDQ